MIALLEEFETYNRVFTDVNPLDVLINDAVEGDRVTFCDKDFVDKLSMPVFEYVALYVRFTASSLRCRDLLLSIADEWLILECEASPFTE